MPWLIWISIYQLVVGIGALFLGWLVLPSDKLETAIIVFSVLFLIPAVFSIREFFSRRKQEKTRDTCIQRLEEAHQKLFDRIEQNLKPDDMERLGIEKIYRNRTELINSGKSLFNNIKTITGDDVVVISGISLNLVASTDINSALLETVVNHNCVIKLLFLKPNTPPFEQLIKEKKNRSGVYQQTKTAKKYAKICQTEAIIQNAKGRIELYEYTALPYCGVMSIKSANAVGRMLITPYVYGKDTPECPSLELTEKDGGLYEIYYTAITSILDSELCELLPTESQKKNC